MFHHNTMKRDGFSADMDYEKFLKRKEITIENTGFEPDCLNANLFDFQRDIVRWALRKGKAALFEDTGVRKAEALSLWKGDFSDGSVHVRGTKTVGSDRVLTLAPSLCAILKPVLASLESDDDLVFPMSSVTMHSYFQAYTAKSGLPPIRIHDLRHSFATNMIGHGANIVAVSKYLGHSSINQTLKTYAHLLQKADDEMVNMINGIMTVSQPSQSA